MASKIFILPWRRPLLLWLAGIFLGGCCSWNTNYVSPDSPAVQAEQNRIMIEDELPKLAATLLKEKPDQAGMEKLFTAYLDQHPAVYGVAFAPPRAPAGEPVRASPYVYRKNGVLSALNLAKPDYLYETMEWYALPVKRRAAAWTSPYFDQGGGDIWMVTYSLPLYLDEAKTQLYGVLTDDLPVPAPKGK